MKTRTLALGATILGLLWLLFLVPAASWGSATGPAAQATAAAPLPAGDEAEAEATPVQLAAPYFVENKGQWDGRARFQARSGRATLWLADDALWLTLFEDDKVTESESDEATSSVVNLRLTFPGANPSATLEPFGRLATKVSYFTGNDPAGWRPDVPVWGGARYQALYPGYDLEIITGNSGFAWRLVAISAQPAAPLPDVRLSFEGADGLTIEKDDLVLQTAVGALILPLIEAASAGHFMPSIEGSQVVAPVRFSTPAGNNAFAGATVIEEEDTLGFSTYLGGNNDEAAHAVVVGPDGAVYVAGETFSTNFPTTPGAFDPSYDSGSDFFVSKFSREGSTLLASTYLGGSGFDTAYAIDLDDAGTVYVGGFTASSNFPATAGAYDTSYNGSGDAVAAKLNNDGTALLYATYVGGSAIDQAQGLAVNSVGAAVIGGYTSSSGYPTTPGAYDTTYNGGGSVFGDGFVTKISPAGSALEFSTFLGGTNEDDLNDVVVDSSGHVYVTGWTSSSNYPTTPDSFGTVYTGNHDFFVTKLDPSGSALIYSGLEGGQGADQPHGMGLDDAGAVYIAGHTNATFPTTPGAFDTTLSGSWDGFVTKITPAGDALAYSTYLGGSGSDCEVGGVTLECVVTATGDGIAYVTGRTSSTDFPTTEDGYDTTYNGGEDTFLARLSQDGSALEYGSYLGGSNLDLGLAVAASRSGDAYVAGSTSSANFPTTGEAYDTTHNGDDDVFASQFKLGAFCGEGFAIPDDDPAGASSTITITDTTSVIDMDVSLSVDHPFVGDLVFHLTHEETGASTYLIHRPGGPPAPHCDGDDIEATLDDEAETPVEEECAPTTPTIDGVFQPVEPLSDFDLESLDGTWRLRGADQGVNGAGQVLDWCLLPTLEPEPVSLVKTVGTDLNACATTDAIDVHPGDEVTYCYEITNNSQTTLTAHDLTDDQLGVILDDYAFDLEPGASTFVTKTAVLTATVTNAATWTASADSGRSAAAGDTATVYVVPVGCSMPLLAIPDNNTTGVSDDVYFAEGGEISDVDVYLQAQHTWVGDLNFTVEHVDTGMAVTIMDRPGTPPLPSCDGDDIDATLDDEAATPVENECAATVPTISGRFTPNNPLSAFDGQDLAGTWRLNASDVIANDLGTLTMWCVQATAGSPAIDVEPEALASTQGTDEIVTLPLTISNNGGSNLEWSLSEDASWATLSSDTGVTAPGASSVVNVSFDALGLTTGDYTSTLTIASDDPVSPIVTIPLTLHVVCEESCLRSVGIRLWVRQQGGDTGVIGRVLVQDENGAPVANAAVFTEWSVTLASGATFRLPVDTTNGSGVAQFSLVSGPGTYTLIIVDITKPDYLFDPANSILSKTIVIPGSRGAE